MSRSAAIKIRKHIRNARNRGLDSGYVFTDAVGEGGAYYTANVRIPSDVFAWDVARVPSVAEIVDRLSR